MCQEIVFANDNLQTNSSVWQSLQTNFQMISRLRISTLPVRAPDFLLKILIFRRYRQGLLLIQMHLKSILHVPSCYRRGHLSSGLLRRWSNFCKIPIASFRKRVHLTKSSTNSYFDKWHYTAPMLQRARYMMSLYLPSLTRPPMCLQYVVMAWGAEIANTHRQLAMPFYKRARAYAEADEIKVSSVTLGSAMNKS